MSVTGDEVYTLVRTKLHKPRSSGDLVSRPRLLQRLNLGLDHELTLVSAPAGYGKTTLVTAWLQEINHPSAWLSLDETDNDLILFLRYIVAAIQSVLPNACAGIAQLLQTDQAPPPDCLRAQLINDIVSLTDSFVLVMDDYHLIHNEAIHTLMAGLINNQPANLHLVLTTRSDPLLPLPRLRATGKLTEIRAPDLRFQDEEVRLFLQQILEADVDPQIVKALTERTEGWIVGLHLVALSLHGQRDLSEILERFQGESNAFVNEYLVSEVMAQLPEAIRDFMLKTSILDRLCGPLCEAITGVDDPVCDGQAYLEWMETENLFVVSLDERREWYRYHHLFQELLLGRLQATCPAREIHALHHRAGRWFADHGYIEEAIQHALAGDDVDSAGSLVEEQCQNLLNSQDRSTLERWLAKLPEDIVWRRPTLLIAKAWLLFREWRLAALEEILAWAEGQLEAASPSEKARSLTGQLAALRSTTAYSLWEDYSSCLSLADQALQLLPIAEHGARGIAAAFRAFALQALGNQETAVRALTAIIRSQTQSGPSKIQAFISLSACHQMAGELIAMSRVTDQFLTLAFHRNHPNAVAAANKFAGWLNYEWNDLDKAAGQFTTTVAYRYQSNFMAYFDAALSLARLYLAQGMAENAQTAIEELREATLRLNNTELLGPLEAFQACLWLVLEDNSSALRWARSIDPDDLHESILLSEVASLTHTRILIWSGTDAEVQTVTDFLKAKLTRARSHHFTLREIQIQIHLALAYQRLGDIDQALAMLERSVLLAQPGGFIRTFLDMGRPLADLLAALSIRLPAASQPYIKTLITHFESDKLPVLSPSGPQPRTVESITRREMEILHLMQARKTDPEIAEDLVIALSTARRHASNIYRKLDVNNRRDAVRKAELLGVIPSD